MSALEQMVRLHRWQLDETRRKLTQLEQLARAIEQDIEELDRRLANEEARADDDVSAAALPAFAASCAKRREALENSLAAVERSAEQARDEVKEAFREVKAYETVIEARRVQAERKHAKHEQAVLDEIGLNQHVRGPADGRAASGRRLGGHV